jgi:hypothetical protein
LVVKGAMKKAEKVELFSAFSQPRLLLGEELV